MRQLLTLPDFPSELYGGTKELLFSTRTTLGGKNPFLGIAYVVVAGICIVLGAIFTAMHLIKPRYGHRVPSWHKPRLTQLAGNSVITHIFRGIMRLLRQLPLVGVWDIMKGHEMRFRYLHALLLDHSLPRPRRLELDTKTLLFRSTAVWYVRAKQVCFVGDCIPQVLSYCLDMCFARGQVSTFERPRLAQRITFIASGSACAWPGSE